MPGPRLFWLTAAERFGPSPGGETVLFPGEELTTHLTRSLRCRVGDRFVFCQPDSRRLFSGNILVLSPLSIGLIPLEQGEPDPVDRSTPRFSLAIAPLKGDFLSETIAQAVMCGIDRIFWLTTDRGVVRWDPSDYEKKKGRMESLVREKSQLSGRTGRMDLSGPLSLEKLSSDPLRALLFFDESDPSWGPGAPWWEVLPRKVLLSGNNRELVAVIGPEGGWSERERDWIRQIPADRLFRGALGPGILSAEAAILAVSSLLGLAGGYAREAFLRKTDAPLRGGNDSKREGSS